MRLRCPKCREITAVEAPAAGGAVPCTHCGCRLRVPAPKAAPPPPRPAAPPPPPPPPVEDDLEVVPAGDEDVPSVLPVEENVTAAPPAPRPRRSPEGEAASRGGPAGRFKVRQYAPDGGVSPSGVVLALVLVLLAGSILGVVASLVGQFFYLILLFPALIGLWTGMAGALGVRLGKLRNLAVATLVGLLGGCLAMFAMHFCDYLLFRVAVALEAEEAEQQQANQPSARQMAMGNGAPVPPAPAGPSREEREVRSFLGYVDYTARQGVSIGRAGSSGGGINLGYIGTYIYYLIEVLIVAAVSLGCVAAATTVPFCRACDTWKKQHKLGPLDNPPEEAVTAVRKGDLHRLQPAEDDTAARLQVHVCPKCGGSEPVEVEVVQVTQKAKNQATTSQLVRMTYPGEALDALQQLFPDADLGDGTPRPARRRRR